MLGDGDRPRVLFTCRDPLAAQNLAPLALYFNSKKTFWVTLLAQEPAYSILRSFGSEVQPFLGPVLQGASDPLRDALLSSATLHLEKIQPDIVFCGLSGPGLGVDEAVLQAYQGRLSFSYQDAEGWHVEGFGKSAQHIFVISDEAAQLAQKHGKNAYIVGLPKYRELFIRKNTVDLPKNNQRHKRALFCGQPLWGRAGYLSTLKRVANVLKSMGEIELFYRMHPKEPDEKVTILTELGYQMCRVERVDESLAISEIIISCYSNCLVDALFFRAAANGTGQKYGYMLFEEDIVEAYKEGFGGMTPWNIREGLSEVIKNESEFEEFLRVSPKEIEIKLDQLILDSKSSVERIYETVVETASKIKG